MKPFHQSINPKYGYKYFDRGSFCLLLGLLPIYQLHSFCQKGKWFGVSVTTVLCVSLQECTFLPTFRKMSWHHMIAPLPSSFFSVVSLKFRVIKILVWLHTICWKGENYFSHLCIFLVILISSLGMVTATCTTLLCKPLHILHQLSIIHSLLPIKVAAHFYLYGFGSGV